MELFIEDTQYLSLCCARYILLSSASTISAQFGCNITRYVIGYRTVLHTFLQDILCYIICVVHVHSLLYCDITLIISPHLRHASYTCTSDSV